MAAFSFIVKCFLASIPLLQAAEKSFLQRRWLHRSAKGDWDESEVKLCTFSGEDDSDMNIKIFADEIENTRYVSFAREGSMSDDGFIESMQKCKGSLAESCKQPIATSTPKDCAACPCELDLEHEPFGNYQRRILELVTPKCQAAQKNKEPFRVLLVGLGGGALVQYVLGSCPQGTIVEAVEYDRRMIQISKQFFGLNAGANVFSVEQGDGGAVVASHAEKGKTFDMILVDAFAGGSHVPKSCQNKKFVTNLQRLLKKGGTAIQNLAGPTLGNLEGPDDYKTAFPLYKKVFGESAAKMEELTGNMEFPARLIVAQK